MYVYTYIYIYICLRTHMAVGRADRSARELEGQQSLPVLRQGRILVDCHAKLRADSVIKCL